MGVNKNALIRYQTLDKCFRNNGRMYFWKDLLEECNKSLLKLNPNSDGIQRRQLFNDIKFMESDQGWSIPLERIQYGRKTYYRYSDTNFSINQQPLLDIEAENIKSALQVLTRFSGSPQFDWVNEMIPKLESKFGLKKEKRHIISFDENLDLIGKHFIPILYKAIKNNRVLEVEYKDFKSPQPYVITFHPYYLKQYNNRWFVYGLNQQERIETWNLALDRIVSIIENSNTYKPNKIDWENEYFYDIIGVTRPADQKIEKVVLKFNEKLAPYITTKPIHPSQKAKLDDLGNLLVRINVIPNYELERLILSYGDGVEVVQPKRIRKKICETLKNTINSYK
ncbi:MAG: WYL domain-containing protein [Flavobacteriaceae bacterium]|nr:WYL domain-containing protein [Flavobacteriaceae bacterium]